MSGNIAFDGDMAGVAQQAWISVGDRVGELAKRVGERGPIYDGEPEFLVGDPTPEINQVLTDQLELMAQYLLQVGLRLGLDGETLGPLRKFADATETDATGMGGSWAPGSGGRP